MLWRHPKIMMICSSMLNWIQVLPDCYILVNLPGPTRSPSRTTERSHYNPPLKLHAWEYSFWVPTHKADTTFEGNRIIIWKISNAPDPCPIMEFYTTSHGTFFPFHPQLWIRANETVPLCSWLIACLQWYFETTIAGQSMCAGGATAMAEAGAVPELIKGTGQWGSTAFEPILWKNPVVLHALILSWSLHYDSTTATST